MSTKQYMSYDNAVAIVNKIASRLNALTGAFQIRGSVASVPTLSNCNPGDVYNITSEFTTTADFVEGAGIKYPAGTDIYVADLSTYATATPAGSENPTTEGWYELVNNKYVLSTDTEVVSGKTYYIKTENIKWTVGAGFIDVDAIEDRITNVREMISDTTFDTATAYAIGDIVTYEDGLYQFNAAHSAGAWTGTDVDEIDILDLIASVEPDEFSTAQVNALKALLD
jgi:hypothetical protein